MRTALVILLLTAFGHTAPALADTLNVPGSISTVGTGINNLGEVVGYFSEPADSYGFDYHGFTWSNGVYSIFDPPGAQLQADKMGINDVGEVVGTTSAGAFLLANGTWTPLSVPNSTFTNASAINNAGQIVGSYLDAAGKSHPYIYSNGVYTTLPVPVGTYESVRAIAINNHGDIVLDVTLYRIDVDSFVYSYANGTSTPVYAGMFTLAEGINDFGDLVGSGGGPGGFFYSGGKVTPLPQVAYSINNSGQIVGTGYMITATPEPGSLALSALALCALAAFATRRRNIFSAMAPAIDS
jgi:probable HAF family extracellular repeat protein